MSGASVLTYRNIDKNKMDDGGVNQPATNNATFSLNDGANEVPADIITHVKVDSSVTAIPLKAFSWRTKLQVVELPEGRQKYAVPC